MAELFTFGSLSALLTLAALEIVLGIDNVVFIAILSGKLPKEQQAKARRLGLTLAAVGRIVLLFAITWVVMLEGTKVATLFGQTLSVKDIILILGGVFLVGKATWEIHHNIEGQAAPGHDAKTVAAASFGSVIGQILLLDLVFSIDSVLTAVGMVNPSHYQSAPFPFTDIPWVPLTIMCTAILLSIAIMLLFAGPVARFVHEHPAMKMLALSFLLLIGVVLVAEGFHQHIPRGYIYFAMGFSLFVEVLNLQLKKGRKQKAQPA